MSPTLSCFINRDKHSCFKFEYYKKNLFTNLRRMYVYIVTCRLVAVKKWKGKRKNRMGEVESMNIYTYMAHCKWEECEKSV